MAGAGGGQRGWWPPDRPTGGACCVVVVVAYFISFFITAGTGLSMGVDGKEAALGSEDRGEDDRDKV